MKVIEEIRKVEQPVKRYVAYDGTEFEHSYQCRAYERSKYEEEVFATVEYNEKADTFAPCDGGEYMEDHSYHWFRPHSEKDVDLLKLYGAVDIDYDDIGKWICLDCGDDEAWCSLLDVSIKYAKELIGFFGYKVLVLPEQAKHNDSDITQVTTAGDVKRILADVADDCPLLCCGTAQPYINVSKGVTEIICNDEGESK